MRVFETGALRSPDDCKPDYEGFLSPLVIEAYGRYMLKHRKCDDGLMRASDNWQRGMPRDQYLKSAWRHFLDWWALHRGVKLIGSTTLEDAICALLFNAMGYLHELLRAKPVPNEVESCIEEAKQNLRQPKNYRQSETLGYIPTQAIDMTRIKLPTHVSGE